MNCTVQIPSPREQVVNRKFTPVNIIITNVRLMSFSLRRWLTPVVCVASRYSNEYKPTFPLIIIVNSLKFSKLCDPHLLTPYPSLVFDLEKMSLRLLQITSELG